MKRLILLLCFLIAGCSGKFGGKMENAARIYVETLRIDEKYAEKKDSLEILRNETYKKWGFTRDEYKEFFESLSTDKEKWNQFFSYAKKYLDTLKNRNQLQ